MKRKLYIFLCLFGCIYFLQAYYYNVESFPKHKEEDEIKALTDLDDKYIQNGQFDLFLKNHKELEKKLLKCKGNCDYYQVMFYNQSVLYYSTKDDYKKIFSFLQKIISYKTKDRKTLVLKINAYRNIIAFLLTIEQYDEAQRYATEAESFIKENSIEDIFAIKVYVEIGNINFALLKNAELLKAKNKTYYFKQCRKYYLKAYNIIKNKTVIPEVGFDKNNYQQSMYLVASGLYRIGYKAYAEKIFENFDALNKRGKILYKTYLFSKWTEFDLKSQDSTITKPDNLIANIDKVISYNDSTLLKEQNTYFYLHKARVLYRIKKYTCAEKEYKIVFFRLNKYGNDLVTKFEVVQALGNIYEILKRREKAILFKNKALQLSKIMTKENSPYSIQKAEIVLLLEKQRQNRLLELETLKAERVRNYFFMAFGGIFFVLLLLFVYNRNLIMKQKILESKIIYNKEVSLKNELESIYQLKMELFNKKVLSENQKKIAKNLHDDLASSLAATSHFVQDKIISADEKNRRNFVDIKKEIDSLYNNIRGYIYNLNYHEEQIFSINEYLLELITKNSSSSLVHFEIDADFENMDNNLNIFQQNQLYRIIKEAVTNSLKYSQSKTIHIQVKFSDLDCFFLVSDDGVGTSQKNELGIGLKSIDERVNDLKGKVSFVSKPNEGFTIYGQFKIFMEGDAHE